MGIKVSYYTLSPATRSALEACTQQTQGYSFSTNPDMLMIDFDGKYPVSFRCFKPDVPHQLKSLIKGKLQIPYPTSL